MHSQRDLYFYRRPLRQENFLTIHFRIHKSLKQRICERKRQKKKPKLQIIKKSKEDYTRKLYIRQVPVYQTIEI